VEQLLERHFKGESTRKVAASEGVSHQTIAAELRDAKREHITAVAMDLLIATRAGEPLWLVVPGTSGAEVAPGLRYLAWLIEELEALTFRVKVDAVTTEDGIAFGLTDTSRVAS
jgi:hypothetical protein